MDDKQLWEYSKVYIKPVDAEWVARQFKLYDQYVKNYYCDPREILNKFNGLSYDEDKNQVAKIKYLAEEVNFGNIHLKICNDNELSKMIKK